MLIIGEDEINFRNKFKNFDKIFKDKVIYVNYVLNPEEYLIASDIFCLTNNL